MEIEKIINNNIIRSSDDLNHEVLVMGCGIGYLKKMGMEIDPQKIDKIYRLQSKQALSNLETLFTGLPLATIQATNDIVDYAKTSLGTQLSDNIYLTLADHIQFAIEREKEGLIIKNALLWEIKQFYHHEFMIGQESLEITCAGNWQDVLNLILFPEGRCKASLFLFLFPVDEPPPEQV